ncbi:MAG: KH domain-containing protein [Nitrososphaerota archaeon]
MSAIHGIYYVNIPKERVPVLLGPSGSLKKKIEEELGVSLRVDPSGVVEISLSKSMSEGGDPVSLLKAKDIVQAIGRGFKPEKALKLLEDDVSLIIIDLPEHLGKDPEDCSRVKARIIGTGGKTRRIIEENAHVDVSIYGDTVAIIGRPEDASAAQQAVMMLINGAPHSAVYKFLDSYAQRRKLMRMTY